MWRQQNKGKDLFEEILNDIAKFNPFPSSKKMLILQDSYIFIFKENAFFLKKPCKNLSRYTFFQ